MLDVSLIDLKVSVIIQIKSRGCVMAFLGLFFLFIIFSIILWFIALVSVLSNEFKGSNKAIWVFVILVLPFLGSLLYLLIGKNQIVKGDCLSNDNVEKPVVEARKYKRFFS